MARVALGGVDLLIDLQRPAGQLREVVQQLGLGLIPRQLLDLGRGGDRPGVDHRVAGDAGGRIEADGIEGLPRGLHPHLALHVLQRQALQRQAVGERFGDRLNRERFVGVASCIDAAIRHGHNDAEVVGIGLGQLRDVVGHGAIAATGQALMQGVQQLLDRAGLTGGGHGIDWGTG